MSDKICDHKGNQGHSNRLKVDNTSVHIPAQYYTVFLSFIADKREI